MPVGSVTRARTSSAAQSSRPTLRYGARGPSTQQLQALLTQAGFSTRGTDGVFGRNTLAAVKAFQRAKGLAADGVVGPRTWAKLAASAPANRPALRAGQRGSAVTALQNQLKRHGFSPGAADGDFGARTTAAVKAFQRAKGLTADGVVGPKTWSKLLGAPSAAPAAPRPAASGGSGPVLRSGHRGAPVISLQQRLAQLGFSPGAADGDFGPRTLSAVKAFQRSRGLSADGVVGAQTWNKLGITVTTRPQGGRATDGVGGVSYGGGWAGSEGVANAAKRIAARMGIPVTSQKRDLHTTRRVGSSTASDHYTGNRTAFAVDFGVSGSRGDALAREIARTYGIPTSSIGTHNRYNIRVGDRVYRVQLLWRVAGHYDHVHFGIRRVA